MNCIVENCKGKAKWKFYTKRGANNYCNKHKRKQLGFWKDLEKIEEVFEDAN